MNKHGWRNAMFGALSVFALAAPAWAQTSTAPAETSAQAGASTPPSADTAPTAPVGFAATICAEPVAASKEAADQQIVESAMNDANTGGYSALARHLEALRGVLAHAPACYPEVERQGDKIIVRSDVDSSAVLALLVASAAQHENVSVVRGVNPYAYASLLLGAYSNEMRQFDEGVAWLDRGLALQPHEQHLVLEKATALGQLRRFDEQVALLQGELDDPFASLSLDKARYERNLGIALIDANRLDDAEAALRESIRLQPNNPNAEHELEYIARLRAGGQRTTAVMGHIQP
jgi:tetratricopeptide (TPR) repeat protein